MHCNTRTSDEEAGPLRPIPVVSCNAAQRCQWNTDSWMVGTVPAQNDSPTPLCQTQETTQ